MNKKQRTYSSSSEEDEPLSSILIRKKRNENVVTKYDIETFTLGWKKGNINMSNKNMIEADICTYSCDFCDVSIENKLKLLIHTVDHLIIPLINLKIHQCSECLFCFTSLNSLQEHITSKHPITIDGNQLQTSSHENIEINSDVEEPILPPVEIKTECESVPIKIGSDALKLKNRIVFEDDPDDEEDEIFSDELLNDLTTDCKVNLEILDTPFLKINENGYSNEDFDYDNKGLQDLTMTDLVKTDVNVSEKTIQSINTEHKQHVNVESERTVGTEEVEYSASVHYSELIRPGIYRCKKCQKMFSNRFEMIQHEATHIRYKKLRHVVCNLCDWYIGGSGVTLHRHFVNSHPHRGMYKRQILTKCNICGLKYANYDRHSINYHKTFPCNICGSYKESYSIAQHMKEHNIHNASQPIGENSAIPHQNIEHSSILHRNSGNDTITHRNGENSAILHQNSENGAITHQNGENSAILHQNDGNGAIPYMKSVTSAISHRNVEMEFKFCDVCFMFIRSNRGYIYTVQGNIKSVHGMKLKCDDCKKMCDNLKFVKRRKRNVTVERIYTCRKEKKALSNEARLRNIQNRLKLCKNYIKNKK